MSFIEHCSGKAIVNICAYCVLPSVGFCIIQSSNALVVLEAVYYADSKHSFLLVQTFYG